MQFGFDAFTLDTGRGLLSGPEGEVPLEPRAWTVLCHLVENHDRLVSREELIEEAWDGRIVSDAAVATVIKAIRKALGDDGSKQTLLRTMRGRGFRFAADVRILSGHAEIAAAAIAATWIAGDHDRARDWVRILRDRRPDADIADFFRALSFASGRFRKELETALREAGVPEGS